jgi:hypothetical protein
MPQERSNPEAARLADSLVDKATGRLSPTRGDAGLQQTTIGAAGGASALPATPLGYFKMERADGTIVAVPYFTAA